MRVDFYHLSRDPAPAVLALIAAKVLDAGQRLLVVADDQMLSDALSDALWAAPGFLANGAAHDTGADAQPILMAADAQTAANGARFIALADGQWRDEALSFDRTFLLFDAQTIDGARGAWRMLGECDGVERHYWKFVDGRWIDGP